MENDIFGASLSSNSATLLSDDDFLALSLSARELSQQINWVKTQKKREYMLNLLQLKDHKSVDVRRKSATALGSIANSSITEELKLWQGAESDRQTWVILESLIDKLKRGVLDHDVQSEDKILSVTEALALMRNIVGEREYIIEGELAEVRAIRNMYYFAIKDSLDTRINCWMFGGTIERLRIPMNEGLQVRITGNFKLSKDSRLYVDVKKLVLTGEGELLRNLKILEDRLTQEGLFDPTRKRFIPLIPNNILLIASPNSAALTDFQKVLRARRSNIRIYFLPIKTQGVGSEFDVCQTLDYANEVIRNEQIDVVVITRGGGSQDDLSVFNSEKVVRAIHGLKAPVIAAIGHERDITLSEKSSDLRASTPSNAAELVSLSDGEILLRVNNHFGTIMSISERRLNDYLRVNRLLIDKITQSVGSRIREHRSLATNTDRIIRTTLQATAQKTQSTWFNIYQKAHGIFNQAKFAMRDWELITQNTRQIISNQKNTIALIEAQLSSHDPRRILQNGYALITQNTKLIDSISLISEDSRLKIQLKDGVREIQVKIIRN